MPITNQEELNNANEMLVLFTTSLVELIGAVTQRSRPEANKAAAELISFYSEAIKQ